VPLEKTRTVTIRRDLPFELRTARSYDRCRVRRRVRVSHPRVEGIMRRINLPLGVLVLAGAVLGQSPAGIPTEAGMYLARANSNTKILGQIVTFTRTGSLAVSALTAGIKTAKANVQLLGRADR
jgi:hypothetical protein